MNTAAQDYRPLLLDVGEHALKDDYQQMLPRVRLRFVPGLV